MTNTDVSGLNDWAIDDAPMQLRRWGTSIVYALPAHDGEFVVGASEGCWLKVQDPEGRVSRQHAKLRRVRGSGAWQLVDLHSKNGIYQDGSRRSEISLAPGLEVMLGGVAFVVESPKLVALRELLARLIGWRDDRRVDVDLALRVVRAAAKQREPLQLCGDGDIVALAQQLHAQCLGDARPFIVCDPARRRSGRTARTAPNVESGMAALAAAAGGTLCIWQDRQPADFAHVLEARKHPACDVRLTVCTHALETSDVLISSPIVLPPLASRADELDLIIDAYAVDAGASPGATLTSVDRAWLRGHGASSLAAIQKATLRLVAIRQANGSITRAAQRLNIAHGALSEWFARRTLEIDDDDADSVRA